MRSSHVSVCGKLGMVDLYVEIQFQTAAASFEGTKSRKVDVGESSSALAARNRTNGSSCKHAMI